MEEAFTNEELGRLRRLIDEDDIRKLGSMFYQYLDHGYDARLAELFTEDVVCEFGPYGVWEGLETVMENFYGVREQLGGTPPVTLHAGGHHWIAFQDRDHATGRRQLLDFMVDKKPDENPLLWLALYDEEYRRVDGNWKIARTSVQFLWPERHVTDGFPGDFPG